MGHLSINPLCIRYSGRVLYNGCCIVYACQFLLCIEIVIFQHLTHVHVRIKAHYQAVRMSAPELISAELSELPYFHGLLDSNKVSRFNYNIIMIIIMNIEFNVCQSMSFIHNSFVSRYYVRIFLLIYWPYIGDYTGDNIQYALRVCM